MTTGDVISVDVTISHAHRRDVSDGNDGDWLTTTTEAVPVDEAGCQLYSFVISSLLIGFLIVFGFIGNCTAFLIFQRDSLKTSTSFLFQASQSLCLSYAHWPSLPSCTECGLTIRTKKEQRMSAQNRKMWDRIQ